MPHLNRCSRALTLPILAAGFFCSAAVAALPSFDLRVEATKTTRKTSESGGTSARTAHYVDRTILTVSVAGVGGSRDLEVTCYFVARNVQTHALKYCGFEKLAVALVPARQSMRVESQPVHYSQSKRRDSTAESKRGEIPFGWVVIVSAGGQEIAVKSSAPEVVSWIRKYPPRLRTQASP